MVVRVKTHKMDKFVWVDRRLEFALEVLNLVERGLIVALEEVNVPKDQCIPSSEMEKAFIP